MVVDMMGIAIKKDEYVVAQTRYGKMCLCKIVSLTDRGIVRLIPVFGVDKDRDDTHSFVRMNDDVAKVDQELSIAKILST
jgi:hypothetical protein